MKLSSLILIILLFSLPFSVSQIEYRELISQPATDIQRDTTSLADSTGKVLTEEEFLKKYVHDPCNPTAGIQMKIFVPDSTLTASMPILFAPPVDEGIFINNPPYCSELPVKLNPEEGGKKEDEK